MNILARLLCALGTIVALGGVSVAAFVWLPMYPAGMVGAIVVIASWYLSGRLEKEFRP